MNTRGKRHLSNGFRDEVARLLKDFHDELEKPSRDSSGLAVIVRKYRDKLLNRQDSTAICAYAIKTVIESRGDYPDGADWESFRELAKQAERPTRDHKREEERRRMRALAVLWGQWSLETVTHYKWELHSPKLLTDLGKVATRFPRWPDFVQNLNHVMLSRHEQSLHGGRIQRIGYHHSSSGVRVESSPLEACDVERLLDRAPSDEELQNLRDRVQHWTRGTYTKLEVHGKCLKEYSNIDHFRIQVDRYGMLIRTSDSKPVTPRNRKRSRATSSSLTNDDWTSSDEHENACSGVTADDTFGKRQRKEHVEPAEEALPEIGGRQAGGQKKTKISSTLGYLSPPTSSPQSHSISSTSKSINNGDDGTQRIRTAGELSYEGISSTCLGRSEASRSIEMDHSDIEEEGSPISLRNEARSIDQPGTSAPSHCSKLPQIQDSPTPPSSPLSSHSEVTVSFPAKPAYLSQQGQGSSPQAVPETTSQRGPDGSSRCEGDATPQPGSVQPRHVSSVQCEPRSPLQSESNISLQHRHGPDYPPPSEQAPSAQAGSASLPPPNSEHKQHNSRFGNRPPPSITLPSPSAQSVSSSQLERFNFDPRGISNFDAELRTPCNSPSSNQVSFAAQFPALRVLQDNFPPDRAHTPSQPSGSAISSSSSWLNWIQHSPNASSKDPVAAAWIALQELQRYERVEPFTDDIGGDKFHVATPKQIQAALNSGVTFKKPIVTKYNFQDSNMHTPGKFATDIRKRYAKRVFRVRFPDGHLYPMEAHQLAKMIDDRVCGSYNVLDIGALTKAHIAPFLQHCRLSLLDDLVVRTMHGSDRRKEVEQEPLDVTGSLQFDVLGFPGAFSGPQLAHMAGTQFRMLFGKKRMMVVLFDDLTNEERAEFAQAGLTWCPPPEKGQLVHLEEDDVVLIPPGGMVIYSFYTDELAVMEGGTLWDFLAVIDILYGLHFEVEHQLCSDQWIARQLPRILDELERWVGREPERFALGDPEEFRNKFRAVLNQLKTRSCNCSDCRSSHCSCEITKRRCTYWCRTHRSKGNCTLYDSCLQLKPRSA